jgi:hypothetical protein
VKDYQKRQTTNTQEILTSRKEKKGKNKGLAPPKKDSETYS